MPDDKTKRGPADANRVNVNEDYEVRYWCEKWNVTAAQLKDCVRRVGPMKNDVARCLGKGQ